MSPREVADAPRERPAIGVLGGMGPEATVDLMARVVARMPAEDDADHVRLIVDQNPQVPSRIKALIEGTGESPAPVLLEMARGLASLDVAALAIPCNTAHAYLPELVGRVDAPFLDMVALTAARLAGEGHRRIGLLASTAVRITGLYETAFAARGMEQVFPERQDEVMDIIRAVKRAGAGEAERALLADIARGLAGETDMLCLACTELSVLADAIPAEIPRLDAMDVLADEIIRIGAPERAPA
jgi:aspartate racemase